jgi:hypothetical protein
MISVETTTDDPESTVNFAIGMLQESDGSSLTNCGAIFVSAIADIKENPDPIEDLVTDTPADVNSVVMDEDATAVAMNSAYAYADASAIASIGGASYSSLATGMETLGDGGTQSNCGAISVVSTTNIEGDFTVAATATATAAATAEATDNVSGANDKAQPTAAATVGVDADSSAGISIGSNVGAIGMNYFGHGGTQSNCGTISVAATNSVEADLTVTATATAGADATADADNTDSAVLTAGNWATTTATAGQPATGEVAAEVPISSFALTNASGMYYEGDGGVQGNSGAISLAATSSLSTIISSTAAATGTADADTPQTGDMVSAVAAGGTSEAMAISVAATIGKVAFSMDIGAGVEASGMHYFGYGGVQGNSGMISLAATTDLAAILANTTTADATSDALANANVSVVMGGAEAIATATAESAASAEVGIQVFAINKAYGMFYKGNNGIQSNCGAISVTASTGSDVTLNVTAAAKADATAEATAMATSGSSTPVETATPKATATATASILSHFIFRTEARGMSYVGNNGFQKNCGTISVTAVNNAAAVINAIATANETADPEPRKRLDLTPPEFVKTLIQASSFAAGMYNEGQRGIQTNCGRIFVTATSSLIGGRESEVAAYGMYSTGDHAVLTNCGEIFVKAVGDGENIADAIRIEGEFNTLNLLSGSRMVGDVFFDTPPILNVGCNLNLVLTTVEEQPILGAIARPHIGVGSISDPLIVLDTTGFALQSDVVVDLADAVLDGVSSGYSFCAARRCGFWAEGVGSYRKRTEKVSYHNEQGGVLAGYSMDLFEGVGSLFGGVIASRATVTGNTQEAELSTPFLGLRYERVCDSFAFGVAVAGGPSSWDNDRYVENNKAAKGVEKAHSEPDGTFFTVQAFLSHCFACYRGAPTLYGDVRYAGLSLGDYREQGSAANFAAEGRDVNILTGRLVLQPSWEDAYSYCILSPFVGIVGRHQLDGEEVKGKMNGRPLSFTQEENQNSIAGLLGVRASGMTRTLEWSVRLEGTVDSESGSRILAHLGVERSF